MPSPALDLIILVVILAVAALLWVNVGYWRRRAKMTPAERKAEDVEFNQWRGF